MKKQISKMKGFSIAVLAGCLLLSPMLPFYEKFVTPAFNIKTGIVTSTNHPKISINGNLELTVFSSKTGSGSAVDPYVIQNLIIDAGRNGSAIFIQNTNAYLIIQNCTVFNSGYYEYDAGIRLENVTNAKLLHNTALNNTCGVYLISSFNNTISSNNAFYNKYIGISLEYSRNDSISGNNASNNKFDGIRLSQSSYTTISGNNLSFNKGNGISLGVGCNRTTISGNKIVSCGIVIGGLNLNEYASYTIDPSNDVNGKPVYYYVHRSRLGNGDFTNAGEVILVNCTSSIVSGLNVSGGSIGIALYYSRNNTISGNKASNNNYNGIYLLYSNNNTILGNSASFNLWGGISLIKSNNTSISGNNASSNVYYGISLYESKNNTVSRNNASNNIADGISLDYSSNDTISGNTLVNCGIVIEGWNCSEFAFYNIDSSNTVNGKPIYYYSRRSGLGIGNFINAGQVILVNCTHSILSGQDFSNGSIEIALYYCSNNTISGNKASHSHVGVYMDSSNNNTISRNNISSNNWNGLYLASSNHNAISGNNVSENVHGIYLYYSSNNTISGNFFLLNKGYNAYCDGGTGNAWDNGTRGNYWDDYTKRYPQATNNGIIWNTPYIISSNDQDHLPIAGPNEPPAITHPGDISYISGYTGNTISWIVTDNSFSQTKYVVYLNGSIVNSGAWTPGMPITMNIDGLSVGSYNFTIVVDDDLGGTARDEVIAIVKGTSTLPEFLLNMSLAFIIIAAIIAIIALAVVQKRRITGRAA